MKYEINNLEELNNFAKDFAEQINYGDVYSLIGDLGAGKTTLVQMLGKHMGVDDYITSPTYSIVNVYKGERDIFHLDLYRLEDPSELEAFDYETYFYPEGVCFIEWPSKGKGYLPENMKEIKITVQDNKRIIEISE